MRALLCAAAVTAAAPPAVRALQLAARPLSRPAAAPLSALGSPMGQALSLLPGRRGAAAKAAKAGKAAIDRPAEEDPDLWWARWLDEGVVPEEQGQLGHAGGWWQLRW